MTEPTFTEAEQQKHRTAFIHECRQKAWGAACNAEWIGTQMDELMAQYTKMQEEDRGLEAEFKTLETALDSHTKDNRDKRKALQERRTALANSLQALGQNATEAQRAMQNLYASVETNLALAKHAEGWAWREVGASDGKAPESILQTDQSHGTKPNSKP
jgi:chromosome segregation ATPase